MSNVLCVSRRAPDVHDAVVALSDQCRAKDNTSDVECALLRAAPPP